MTGTFDILFQCIKDRFPKLNWKLGSVLRSLLVDPLEKISIDIDKYLASIDSRSNLQGLLESPAGRDAELDYWMRQLGIPAPAEVSAHGEVTICYEPGAGFTIPEGSLFTWNNGTAVVAARKIVADGGSPRDSRLCKVAVPVTSSSSPAVDIAVGASVVWSAAPDNVTDMYVSTAITGGCSSDSPTAKAALIRAALGTPAMAGSDNIRTALVRKFGASIVDVRCGQKSQVKGFVEVPLYVKPRAIPQASGSVAIEPLTAVEEWLNSTQTGSPFKMICSSPATVMLSIQLDLGGRPLTDSARSAITEYINGKSLDAGVDDAEISAILAPFGQVVKSPILYVADVLGTSRRIAQTGAMRLSHVIGTNIAPTAIYSSFDNIKTY